MAVPFIFENIQNTPVDITKFVTQIDSCKFQGSGKIRSLSLMLNADAGAFVSNSDYAGTDTTPIINQFDKHKITWTDKNQKTKSMIVEVDTELGQKNIDGELLPIEFKGREAALQRRKFMSFFQFKTPKFVIQRLVESYNFNRGTDEPELRTSLGGLNGIETVPNNVTNIYDFTKEISYYDALMQVIRRLNQPAGQGGVGDFYSMTFLDGEDFGNPDSILLNIFIQGIGPVFDLESTVNDPFHSLTYQIQSESGNQIFVRGQQGTGYVPIEFHEFISHVEEINNYPSHVPGESYIAGIFVRGADNQIYRANTLTTNTPPNTDWSLETPDSIIPNINYSHWTNNKATVIKNGMANPTGTFGEPTFDAPAFFDGNLVIREGGTNSVTGTFVFWRDWAHVQTNDPSDLVFGVYSPYFNFKGLPGLYSGTRVLVNTDDGNNPAVGDFAGNDKFGRSFTDSLVMWNGTEWIVIRMPQIGDQVVIIHEGRTWEWNVPIANQNDYGQAHRHQGRTDKFRGSVGGLQKWRDETVTGGTNDVFHHPTSVVAAPGLFPSDINGDDYSSFIVNSAIKATFDFDLFASVNNFFSKFTSWWDNAFTIGQNLLSDGLSVFENEFEPTTEELDNTRTSDFYNFGWWFSFPFPYPFSTYNGITEQVGDLWGAAPGFAQKEDFAVLDLQNPTYSHSGNPGLNHNEVEDMGSAFTGLRFYFLFNIKAFGGNDKPFTGDLDFTVTIYDDLSQVWRQDFVYRFLKDAQEVILYFDGFTVERPSRTPWSVRTAFQNIITPEIEIRSIFEQKRVRFITIQLSSSYDDYERYLPVSIGNIVGGHFGLGVVSFEGTIDAITLLKQPFTSSGTIIDRIINPETIQMPNTRNLRQLRSVAVAMKELNELQFEEYTVVTDLDCSLLTEHSVNLIDDTMVKGSPRKLIVMSENFTWNPTGPNAGDISTKTLVRRLNA